MSASKVLTLSVATGKMARTMLGNTWTAYAYRWWGRPTPDLSD